MWGIHRLLTQNLYRNRCIGLDSGMLRCDWPVFLPVSRQFCNQTVMVLFGQTIVFSRSMIGREAQFGGVKG